MGIPFNLTFKQGNHFIKIQDFRETEIEKYSTDNSLVENVPLTVLFESADPDARFYMDGLDAVPAKELKEDMETGDVYLSPSHNPVILYENKTEYYPFIPGFYRIEVWANGSWAYAWITIHPKQFDRMSWERMRGEVEATLSGLAKDFARALTGAPEEFSQLFFLMDSWYSQVISTIGEIKRWPRERVVKTYRSIPIGRSAVIDMATIRERCSHPEEIRRIKIPKGNISYDFDENRLLKRYIKGVLYYLNHLIKVCESLEKEQLSEFESLHSIGIKEKSKYSQSHDDEYVNDTLSQAIHLKKAFHRLLGEPWMVEIRDTYNREPTSTMINDNRYRMIYKFYKAMSRQDIPQSQPVIYQWKRTDKLYEVWGFIKLIKIIGEDGLGFHPKNGWLFDQEYGLNPELPSGTRINFMKDQLTIQLIYDKKIPRKSIYTDGRQEPLYITHGHNRPDTRLDYYFQDVYIGSLIIDFKYRPRVYLWQEKMIEAAVRPKVMAQLIDYGNSCHSEYLFHTHEGDYNRFRDVHPVLEVWAVYPDQKSPGATVQNDDYRIRLIEMTPGESMEHITNGIRQYTKRLVTRYHGFVRG